MRTNTLFRARCRIHIQWLSLLCLLFTASVSSASPAIVSPEAGTTLSGPLQSFGWDADDVAVEQWWLYAGTQPGGSDIANSGNLGQSTRFSVAGIPVDGTFVYIRLWYFSDSRWRYVDNRYATSLRTDVAPPSMRNPLNGETLAGGKAVFEWQRNNTSVDAWWLYVGSSEGSSDIFNSGPSLQESERVSVEQLPVDGTPVYVRLWYRINGNRWRYVDNIYSTGPAESETTNENSIAEAEAAELAEAAAENLALIRSNPTRNTQFDNNPFRDVPVSGISLSDLTVDDDIYNEALLDVTNSGYFRVKCEVSHFAFDDPIVYPNQPGRAHLHMFFGNTDANAFSTYDSLMNTGTGTCNGEDLNRTAYWVPALLDSGGNALIPDQVMVYYKNDNFRLNGANELVDPFPDNLRMIAGNPSSTAPQTELTGDWGQAAVSFTCGPAYRSDDRRQALIPDCYGNDNRLEMTISFPQCVNEEAGTYLADQSHMSYSENGYYGVRCPDSHPTDISSIMYRIFFNPAANGGALTNLHLSSDVKMDRVLPGGTTAHADWFGAWNPEAMDLWVENCNNTQADCETGLLGRNPAVSLVLRKRGFYAYNYKAPATELVKLCPGKSFNSEDPLRSVAMCRMN